MTTTPPTGASGAPTANWCQSETIVRLSHSEAGNTRLRITLLSQNNPMDEPDDKVIMELSVPEDLIPTVLSDNDDPRMPTTLDVTPSDASIPTGEDAEPTYQVEANLHLELCDELLDSTIKVFVQNQNKEIISSYVFDPDIDDEGVTDLTFVLTLRRETTRARNQLDNFVRLSAYWMPQTGAPDLTAELPTIGVGYNGQPEPAIDDEPVSNSSAGDAF